MSTALAVGAIFAGRYRILRSIAAGGMGAVYEVLHLETERRRALKVMLPHVLQSDDLRERFKREAKVAAHIDSEFIVEVFDAGVDETTQMPFLVMELLRGEELGKRLKRLGRFPPVDVVAHLHQTALALDKTHRASIVHRDLKPENLFLTEREEGPPRIKVLDFGVAKVVAESATAGTTQSIGTPLYMAPEQFNPAARLTGAADLYALGMVAFTLLVGKPYWAEEARSGNVFALANVAVRGPIEPACARAARSGVHLPPAFDAWFARITAPDPGQRFSTAIEAVRALSGALGVASAASSQPWPTTTPSAMGPQASPGPTPAVTAPIAPITAPATTSSARPSPQPSRAGVIVAAAVAIAGLLGVAIYLGVHRSTPSPPSRAAATSNSVATPPRSTPPPTSTTTPSAAPEPSQASPPPPPAPPGSATASPSDGVASASPARGVASAPPSATATPKHTGKPHPTAPSLYTRD